MSRRSRASKAATRRDAAGNVGRGVALDVSPPPPQSSQPGAPPSLTYSGVGADWFGPSVPLQPTAPPQVAGRRNDYQPGWNLQTRPRAYEPISFWELRSLADGYDIMRLVIETRKDQMARQQWNIVPREQGVKLEGELKQRAQMYEKLLRRPDRRNYWSEWIRSVLEDLLVIDQPVIHVRRTLGGDIYSLDQIDGATIKPVIDEWGRQPEPPYAAYQQFLRGLPAINYTSRDLIVRPRNQRVHKFFGYSPVEQVIMTVQIALRRQLWQLAYFTDGNVPDSLIGVPSTWTPDQIRQFQDWFDSMLSGNTQLRRGARFVPGEVAKSYVPTKDAKIFDEAEEWLAKVVCFAFGVSAQPFLKMMNRATAETSVEEAVADGLAPIMDWVANLVNAMLEDEFGEEDLVFGWRDDRAQDPKEKADILKELVSTAIMTPNEARADLKLDPDPSPEADQLGVLSPATGFVPLSTDAQIEQKQKMQQAFPPPPPPTQIHIGPDGRQVSPPPGSEDDDKRPPPGGGKKNPPGGGGKGSAEAAAAEGEGGGAASAKVATPPAHRHVHKGGGTPGHALDVQRPTLQRAQQRLARRLARALSAAGDSVAEQTRVWLDSQMHKSADHGDGKSNDDRLSSAITASQVAQFADGLDLSDLDVITDVTAEQLAVVATDAASQALALVGVTDRSDLVDQVNERAVAYAKSRAAELVGRRVLSDGSVVDNPSPQWAITDSTRTMVRDMIERSLRTNLGSDAIVNALEDDFAFSPQRADMVSRTEVAMANSSAAMDGYRAAAADGVSLQKAWLTDTDPCDICQANADQGAIDLDDDFDSGDSEPPAHPNCECAIVPVVHDDDAQSTDSGDEDDDS